MPLTRLGLSNPVAVAVGCILLVIFGLLSLSRLPIQMTPNIDRPNISISTGWRAAAPSEVESEIIEPQENQLRDVPGLKRMTATARQGRGSINLEFDVGADLNRALIEVINRLNQVPRYPADVTEPTVRVGSDRFGDTIAWFDIRTLPGNDRPVIEYQDFIDEIVKERLERLPGVSSANPRGGRPFEVRITFDPYQAAAIGVDLTRVGQRLGQNNDVSGGFQEVGRRQYTLRFAGQYEIADLENLVLDWRDGRAVYLRDVAQIERTMRDSSGVMTQNGGQSISMNVIAEQDINVLEVMADIQSTIAELERSYLTPAGLEIEQVSDDTIYIRQSVSMVATNLIVGMSLAILVLWWFFRKLRATLMVALAIPLCLCFSFIVLDGIGRTLNVISLAGLAFATGMVLDAAIVVLENIVRQREQGRAPVEAADRGTGQVWGALLASTTTTVAIFVPVIFLQDEAGQLFADLAVVISAAVICSLLVAIVVLPTASYRLLGEASLDDRHGNWWVGVTNFIMGLTDTPRRRWSWIIGLTTLPLLISLSLIEPGVDLLLEAGLYSEAEAEADRVIARAGDDRSLLYPLAERLNERGLTVRGIRIGLRLQNAGDRSPRLLRIVYPFPYRPMVEAEASEKGLDPFLVAALIRQESLFKARISSPAGARGLMQVMPETGRGLARGAGIDGWDVELLFQPEINAHLGTTFLAEQMRRWDGSLPSVFSAYNAGPNRIQAWQRFPEYEDEELFTERIPYRETRDYVKILTRNIAVYRGLYGDGTGGVSGGPERISSLAP